MIGNTMATWMTITAYQLRTQRMSRNIASSHVLTRNKFYFYAIDELTSPWCIENQGEVKGQVLSWVDNMASL
jgi:uncharacterized membrane protein